ncbi:hypothetical protein DAC22_108 [Bacteroides phage DAC22]|nr:hypothetical protein DAC22_108 [Bacteroides phage DAC22]
MKKNIVKYIICYSIIYVSLLCSNFFLGFESTVLVGFSMLISLLILNKYDTKSSN